MNDHRARPPFDPELEPALVELEAELPVMTADVIPELRAGFLATEVDAALDERSVTRRDLSIPGHDGDDISVTVLSKADRAGGRPGIYHLHAGGGVAGDRFVGVEVLADWVQSYDVVVVTVEYRLAPEFPDPYPA